jgi:hypothetical protein
MINYYINSKRIYIDENDYSIIFINKPCLDKGSINDEPSINDERKGNIIKQGNNEHKGSNKDLVYTLDDSYYNFSINPSQLEESMIILK